MRVGVIGIGSMGSNHARVLNDLGVLSAVCDTNKAAPNRTHAKRYTTIEGMLKNQTLDAVTIAVPTSLHCMVGMKVLGAGIPALIEKPLAATAAEAGLLIEAAKTAGVFLSVGLIERHNPAVAELKERWGQLGNVSQIIIRRMGPFPSRIEDSGVILDLSAHDFDLVRHLSESSMEYMAGLATRSVHETREDAVSCIGMTKNGILTTIIENWTTPTKIRDITVHGAEGMFHVNLLMQDITFYANNYDPAEWAAYGIFRGVSEGDRTQYKIDRREPLKQELRAFLRCVEDGTQDGGTPGIEGVFALQLSEKLQGMCEANMALKTKVEPGLGIKSGTKKEAAPAEKKLAARDKIRAYLVENQTCFVTRERLIEGPNAGKMQAKYIELKGDKLGEVVNSLVDLCQ